MPRVIWAENKRSFAGWWGASANRCREKRDDIYEDNEKEFKLRLVSRKKIAKSLKVWLQRRAARNI